MNVFEKIRKRIEEITVDRNIYGSITGCNMGICEDDDCLKCLQKKVLSIVSEVEEEYGNGWIPCSERLPENEKIVEITYTRKHWKTGETLYNTARAFYTDGTLNTEDSGYSWGETVNWIYDEGKDAYIIPEGWWEDVSFGEEFSAVDMPVIAWRELSLPYKPEKGAQE